MEARLGALGVPTSRDPSFEAPDYQAETKVEEVEASERVLGFSNPVRTVKRGLVKSVSIWRLPLRIHRPSPERVNLRLRRTARMRPGTSVPNRRLCVLRTMTVEGVASGPSGEEGGRCDGWGMALSTCLVNAGSTYHGATTRSYSISKMRGE